MQWLSRLYHWLFVDHSHHEQSEAMTPPAPPKQAPKTIPSPAPITNDFSPQTAPSKQSVLERTTLELLAQRSDVEPSKPVEQQATQSAMSRMLASVKEQTDERAWQEPAPFFLADGRTVRGPSELSQAAADMTLETFSHHVTGHRNDFAQWIADIYGDQALASRVRDVRDPQGLVGALGGETREDVVEVEAPKLLDQDPEQLPALVDRSVERYYKEEIASLRQEVERLRRLYTEEVASDLAAQHERDLQVAKLEQERQELSRLREQLKAEELNAATVIKELEQARHDLEKRRSEPQPAHAAIAEPAISPRHEERSSLEGERRIVEMVRDARALLMDGRLDEARQAYSAVRDIFYETKLADDRKGELYNLLRELYTDVELASLD